MAPKVSFRAELHPATIDPADLRALADLAQRAQSALEAGDPRLSQLVAEFNRQAGVSYPAELFLFYGACSAEEFARDAVRRVPKFEDITRDELVALAKVVKGEAEADGDLDWWTKVLLAHLPDPDASALLFWPAEYDPAFAAREPTAEDVVDIALAYQPIPVPLRSGAVLLRYPRKADDSGESDQ